MIEAPRILCQPGRRRGCSACCGLFNLRDISAPALTEFLSAGADRFSDPGCRFDPEKIDVTTAQVRDPFAHICPFQGFVAEGAPGCLCHETYSGTDTRDRSLFGARICGSFLCPAHTVLTDPEKILLTRHAENWYLYSIGIIDPASTSWIINKIMELSGGDVQAPEIFSRAFNRALDIHGRYLNACVTTVFYYSVSEYHLHRAAFSLDAVGEDRMGDRMNEVNEITEAVRDLIHTRSV